MNKTSGIVNSMQTTEKTQADVRTEKRTENSNERIERYVANVGVAIIACILVFFLLEGVFRATGVGELPEQQYRFVKHSTYNPFLIFGPNINKTVQQEQGGTTYWNAQGFRTQETIPFEKDPEEYRIIALGGSSTETTYNQANEHYCGELNKNLENNTIAGKKLRCLNGAKAGYSTAQSLVRLQFDLLAFQPDMITVMNNINDLNVNFFPNQGNRTNYAEKYLAEIFADSPEFANMPLLRESRVLITGYRGVHNVQRTLRKWIRKEEKGELFIMFTNETIPLRLKEQFRRNLKSIVAIGKAHNITVVLMTEPFLADQKKFEIGFGHEDYNKEIFYPQLPEFKRMLEEYNQVIEDVAAEENVPFMDMYAFMGQNQSYFIDSAHYTKEGEEQFGKIYSERLKNIVTNTLENIENNNEGDNKKRRGIHDE